MVILNCFLDFGINYDIISKLFKKSYKDILAIFSKQHIIFFGISIKVIFYWSFSIIIGK